MSDLTFAGVIRLIIAERVRQMAKFPDAIPWQDSDGVKLSVLVEEVGEVARALNDHESPEHLRDELVQVAAVVVKWLEGQASDFTSDPNVRVAELETRVKELENALEQTNAARNHWFNQAQRLGWKDPAEAYPQEMRLAK